MLRWKTQSAICAIVIAACPLTSFAQQIIKPAQPEIAISRQQAIASPDIIIRPPFVQPSNPNLYLFVVENVGTVDATAASVDLYVPKNVTITKVVPASGTGSAQWAKVRMTNLAAGSKAIIEVEISPTSSDFEFLTRMTLESDHTFTTAAQPTYAARPIPNRIAPPTEAGVDSKYLISTAQASHESSPLKPLAPIALASRTVVAANNANATRRPAVKPAAAAGQASGDAKLLKTVESLRLAGQDALADAYIAAIANSSTYRAETF